MPARKAGAVTTPWLTAIIIEGNATIRSPRFDLAPGSARQSGPVLREARQSPYRERPRRGRQEGKSSAPHRTSPDGAVAKQLW